MCNGKKLGNCDMNAGYTGHLNNLDYSICIEVTNQLMYLITKLMWINLSRKSTDFVESNTLPIQMKLARFQWLTRRSYSLKTSRMNSNQLGNIIKKSKIVWIFHIYFIELETEMASV